MNSRDIDRLSIHESRMMLDTATRIKDNSDMLQIALHGGNPEESEYYSKYYRQNEEQESEEDDMKHMAEMMKMIEGMKKNGRKKNTDSPGA